MHARSASSGGRTGATAGLAGSLSLRGTASRRSTPPPQASSSPQLEGITFFASDESAAGLRGRQQGGGSPPARRGGGTRVPSIKQPSGDSAHTAIPPTRCQTLPRPFATTRAHEDGVNPLPNLTAYETAPRAGTTSDGDGGNVLPAEQGRGEGLGTHRLFASYDAVGVEGAAAATGAARGAWPDEARLLSMRLPLPAVLSCLAREQRQAFNRRELAFFTPFCAVFLAFVLLGTAPATHIFLNTDALRRLTDFDAAWLSTTEQQLLLEVFRVDTEGAATNSSGDFVSGTSQRFPWLFPFFNETVNVWTRQNGSVIGPDGADRRTRVDAGGRRVGRAGAQSGGDWPWLDDDTVDAAAADAQVERVAQSSHNTNAMRLSSLRTKGDLMRWLLGPFLENLWDCTNPDYAWPWYQFRRGSQRMVGAVRLTATRAPTEAPVARRTDASDTGAETSQSTAAATREVIPGWCRRGALNRLKNLPCSDVAVRRTASPPSSPSSPLLTAAAGGGTTGLRRRNTSSTAAAPSRTSGICANTVNPAMPTSRPLIHVAHADDTTGEATYQVDLPFPATCHATRSALRHLATPIREENESISIEELWPHYTFTTSDEDSSCAAFFFHPRTTALHVRYAVYGAAVNRYFLVDMHFRFAGAGSVVMPTLRVTSAPALSWRFSFTSLALSITLGVALLLYAHHTATAYMAAFARKRLRWERRGWGGVAGAAQRRRLGGHGRAGARGRPGNVTAVMVVLQDLLRLRSLAHLCLLGLTTAALVVFWWSWEETSSRLSADRPLSFASRLTYPASLQFLCERTCPLYTRLFAAATFCLCVCLIRFACGLFSGLGLVVECLLEATGRLLPLVLIWLWLAIATAVTGMCIFGGAGVERFSDFHNAFLSLLLMFIDRGKSFWADERMQSGFDSMLPSVYGGVMQREGRPAGHVQSYRWVKENTAAGMQAHGVWLFLVVFVECLLLCVFVAAVVTDAFHRTLDAGPNGNKEGVGLEHHQRQLELAVRHVRRCLCSWPYIKECAARLLWSRARVTVLTDAKEQLHLAQTLHSDITYAGLLWLLPRALQAEVGPQQLRLWWLKWAEDLQAQQRARRMWERRQWRRHWDRQPTGLRGWLQRTVPDGATLEHRAAQLGAIFEDLPAKIARHAEGVATR